VTDDYRPCLECRTPMTTHLPTDGWTDFITECVGNEIRVWATPHQPHCWSSLRTTDGGLAVRVQNKYLYSMGVKP